MNIIILLTMFTLSNTTAKFETNNVKLDFKNKNIEYVASWYSKKLDCPIVVDPSFNKNIYLYTPKEINMKDAVEMFKAALAFNGYELINKDKFMVIQKKKEILSESNNFVIQNMKLEPQEIKVFQLKNNNSDNLSRIINELFYPTNNLDEILKILSPQFFNIGR